MTFNTNDAIELGKQVAAAIAPRADEANRRGELPTADITDLTSSGYTSLSVPEEYGGYGASLHACVAAQIELAQGNPSTALVAAMQLQVLGHNREVRSWREEKFAELCSTAVSAGGLFNALATEPALGSPSRGQLFQTTATLSADGAAYRIQGHKTWSTGGEHLTHLLVKLSLVDGGVGTIIVPQNTPGVRWVYSWRDALSLRASDSHDVYFDEVSVPRDNLLEHSENGKRGATNVWFPMVLSGLYLGAAIAARNTVIRYALERVPTALGKPIATLPKIQRQIGEIDMRLQAARALLLDVVRDWEGSAAQRQAIAAPMTAAKTIVTETARQVTDQALQVAGGISLTQALPLERYFRDVRAGEMQPPSGDTALELIGRAAIAAYRPYPEKTKSSTSGGS